MSDTTITVSKYDHFIGNLSRVLVLGVSIGIIAFNIAHPALFGLILKIISFGTF